MVMAQFFPVDQTDTPNGNRHIPKIGDGPIACDVAKVICEFQIVTFPQNAGF